MNGSRLIDGNPHDAGVPVDPAVGRQDCVLLRAQFAQVLPRLRLQARLGRQAVLLLRRERIVRNHRPLAAHVEVVEEQPHREVDEDRGDRQRAEEAENRTDRDVTGLV